MNRHVEYSKSRASIALDGWKDDHEQSPGDATSDDIFLFECPRCRHILEVPITEEKFQCIMCDDKYTIIVSVNKKKVAMAQRMSVLSDSNRQLHAMGQQKLLELQEDEQKRRSSQFGVLARSESEQKLEQRQLFYDSVVPPPQIPKETFERLRSMFEHYDPLVTGKVPALSLHDGIYNDRWLAGDKKFRQMVESVIDHNIDSFGRTYKVRFANFIKEIANYAQRAEEHFGRTQTHAQLARLQTTEVLDLNTQLAVYKSQSCFGRFLFDLKVWWKGFSYHRKSFIPFWNKQISVVESEHGANMASVFYFHRWTYILNIMTTISFLFVLIPGWEDYTWSDAEVGAIVTGVGMEDSWMFYGGYRHGDAYDGGYRMDVAWVLAAGIMLFASLGAAILHIGSGHFGRVDKSFKFCHAVFAGWDHHITDATQAQLQSTSVVTALDVLMRQRRDAELKNSSSWWSCGPRTVGYAFSLFIMVMFLAGVNLLIQLEHELLIPRYQSNAKFLLAPAVVAVGNIIFSRVLYRVVEFEQHTSAQLEFLHYYVRVFIVRMGLVLVFLFSTFNANDDDERQRTLCKETQTGLTFYRVLITDYMVDGAWSIVVPAALVGLRNLLFWCTHTDEAVPASFQSDSIAMNAIEMAQQPAQPDHQHDQAPLHSSNTDRKFRLGRLMTFQLPNDAQNDPLKLEFDIPLNIINAIYRVTLMWCGAPFSPAIPILSVLGHFILFYVKRFQVRHFSKRPKRPMAVEEQNTFFRTSLVVAMVVAVIPFTFFLRRIVDCGAHQLPLEIDGTLYEPDKVLVLNSDGEFVNGSLSIIEIFLKHVDSLPTAVSVAIAYTTNVFILWVVICISTVYLLVLRKRTATVEEDIEHASMRLKMEAKEKQAIIRVYDIVVGQDEARGRDAFKVWIDDLGQIGALYADKLIDEGYGDLLKLARLSFDQLDGLFERIGATSSHIKILKAKVQEQRLEFVKEHLSD